MRARHLALLALLALPLRAHAQPLPERLVRALDARGSGRLPPRFPRVPLLDRARALTGTEPTWMHLGTRGEGASVCVVDTGLDATHHDFRDATGRTRLRFLAEVGAPPRGELPALETRFGGALWSRAAIDDALLHGGALPRDPHGHGTAMASIALGDDAVLDATPGRYAGLAPGASLVAVRAMRDGSSGLEDEDILRGVELCIALAREGDDPPGPERNVTLLALGGHDGAHDGSEPLEQALAALAGEGHTIVVAAGNDGARAVHASGLVHPGLDARVGIVVPTPRDEDEHWLALVVRTDAQVRLRAPDGTVLAARPGERVDATHAGGYLVLDGIAPAEPSARVIRAVVGGGGAHAPLRGGRYELVLEGHAASFDAWIVSDELGPTLLRPQLQGPHVSEGESLTIPGTAAGLITVAATVSRDALGSLLLEARADGSAQFSARGPGVLGTLEPELAAPGGFLAVALSRDVEVGDPHNLLGGSRLALDARSVSPTRIAIEGTSAAAAVVAGAYALAYSLAPSESARDHALLLATAEGATAWSPTLGAGALRVDRWLAARRAADRTVPVDPTRSTLALARPFVVPSAPHVRAAARLQDAEGRPVHGGEVVVRHRGRELARAPIAHGRAELELRVPLVAGERARLDVEAAGVALAPIVLEGRLDPRLDAWPAGGACAIAPSSSHRGLAWLLALATLLVRRRRAQSLAPRSSTNRKPRTFSSTSSASGRRHD